jgi:hypothetical protein
MSQSTPYWLPTVVADLREISADLLEPGLAPPAPIGAMGGHGLLLRGLLIAADTFAALTPKLVSELDLTSDPALGEWRSSVLPRGARPSVAIHDYVLSNGVALPLRWLRFDAEQSPDFPALRWALFVCDKLQQELQTQFLRLGRQLEEASLVRSGDSSWAMQDSQTLRALAQDVQRRVVSMKQAEVGIRAVAGRRIVGNDRAPMPFPQQPAWSRLQRLARDLLNPTAMLATTVRHLFAEPLVLADVPFLYQRWCGLQLVQAFERLGWTRRGDLLGALFLGGRVELVGVGAGQLTIWIEPRVSRATMPLTGWGCVSKNEELTPDFLITCGEAGMRDAFVLDATLGTSDEVLKSKAKYRGRIVGVDTMFVAGVPVARRPLRSWAVAPLDSTLCRLSDPEGRTGGVPLHPGRSDFGALDSWVSDVSLHAQRQSIKGRTLNRGLERVAQ